MPAVGLRSDHHCALLAKAEQLKKRSRRRVACRRSRDRSDAGRSSGWRLRGYSDPASLRPSRCRPVPPPRRLAQVEVIESRQIHPRQRPPITPRQPAAFESRAYSARRRGGAALPANMLVSRMVLMRRSRGADRADDRAVRARVLIYCCAVAAARAGVEVRCRPRTRAARNDSCCSGTSFSIALASFPPNGTHRRRIRAKRVRITAAAADRSSG